MEAIGNPSVIKFCSFIIMLYMEILYVNFNILFSCEVVAVNMQVITVC